MTKSDDSKPILALNGYNKHNFLCIVGMSWLGLCESKNIKQMIPDTVIKLKTSTVWHDCIQSYCMKLEKLKCYISDMTFLFFDPKTCQDCVKCQKQSNSIQGPFITNSQKSFLDFISYYISHFSLFKVFCN